MSRSVNALNADLATPGRGWKRFAQETGLLLGAVVLAFAFLAMLSHDAADPAWSTSGTGVGYRNWGGRLGAWVSDIGYYLFGASVWWLLAAGRAPGWRRWPAGCAPRPHRRPGLPGGRRPRGARRRSAWPWWG